LFPVFSRLILFVPPPIFLGISSSAAFIAAVFVPPVAGSAHFKKCAAASTSDFNEYFHKNPLFMVGIQKVLLMTLQVTLKML